MNLNVFVIWVGIFAGSLLIIFFIIIVSIRKPRVVQVNDLIMLGVAFALIAFSQVSEISVGHFLTLKTDFKKLENTVARSEKKVDKLENTVAKSKNKVEELITTVGTSEAKLENLSKATESSTKKIIDLSNKTQEIKSLHEMLIRDLRRLEKPIPPKTGITPEPRPGIRPKPRPKITPEPRPGIRPEHRLETLPYNQ